MNIDVDFVGQYGMLFVCYVVTVESKFWVAKTSDTKSKRKILRIVKMVLNV